MTKYEQSFFELTSVNWFSNKNFELDTYSMTQQKKKKREKRKIQFNNTMIQYSYKLFVQKVYIY